MNRSFRPLYSADELGRLNVLVAFLEGRLQEAETIDWALTEDSRLWLKRAAITSMLDVRPTRLEEPWRSAWRLIQEYWNTPGSPKANLQVIYIKQRVDDGERTGSLIAAITDAVAPRLEIEKLDRNEIRIAPRKRPKTIRDLLAASLTSPSLVAPEQFGLVAITDRSFLSTLARTLETCVVNALDLAKRIGRDPESSHWVLGGLHRVRYVDLGGELNEPDEHARGIAPAVKLLHHVIERLAMIDHATAADFIARWRASEATVFRRLWASLALDSRLASSEQIVAHLNSLSRTEFWELYDRPEFTELRVRRFNELPAATRTSILRRIKAGPPRNKWRGEAEKERVDSALAYWSVRELRRLQVAGVELSASDQRWLDEKLPKFPDLGPTMTVDRDFPQGVQWVTMNTSAGDQYELLENEARLNQLESDLMTERRHWDDDPSSSAAAWIDLPANQLWIIDAFERLQNAGADYPQIWERFGWRHRPDRDPARNLDEEGDRVLALLRTLPEATISQAIDGISDWLSKWDTKLLENPNFFPLWEKIWPLAVDGTNDQDIEGRDPLNAIVQSGDDRDEEDLDTLNTPAGKLAGYYFTLWQHARQMQDVRDNAQLIRIRDRLVTSTGRAGLIVRHQMIERIGFFQYYWPEWTRKNLVPLLQQDGPTSPHSWRALTRRVIYADMLALLDRQVIARATDTKLGREARKSIVFSVVVGTLHAFRAGRAVPIALLEITQMLRSVDDEVRAHAANALQRFVRDAARTNDEEEGETSEELFRGPTAKFIREVWPQERSLSSPGISQALADLPAASKEAFTDAVNAIERFLVPFQVWSMLEYGLWGDDNAGNAKLELVDNADKAEAFLRLLDKTIGTSEDATIPMDLSEALARIHSLDGTLSEKPAFRRLAAAAP